MRINVIRGQNLASLQSFEVDLTAEPLASAGLFAITGPTGAGKSTLLDALCLALYDTTPRLDERGGVEIGRADDEHKLAANDVKNVLRRGTGEGFAEVEFVGRDGRVYRARWSVRRAYGKADGKFQGQKIDLWVADDDGEWQTLTTDRKTDTLALIADRVGLDFDQFRRSVLLAQGEFDRFLKADAKDRGALLEAMTGADLYRRLGQGAHVRARDVREALDRARHRVEDIPVLADGARRALEREVDEGHGWVEAAAARRAQLEAARRWFARLQTLVDAEAAAETDLTTAEEAVLDANAQQERLEAVEKAEPLREVWRAASETARAAGEAGERMQRRAAAAEAAEAAVRAARAAETAAEKARAAARAHDQSQAPLLAEARRVDARLESAREATERARVSAAEAAARAAEVEARRAEARADHARHVAIIEAGEAWLEQNRAVAGVHDRWDRWSGELRALADERAAVLAAEAALSTARAAAEAADGAVAPAENRTREAEAALKAARDASEGAALTAARVAVEQIEARLATLVERDRKLKLLRDRARMARSLGGQLRMAEAVRDEARRSARSEKARVRRLAKKAETEQAALAADEARLKLLRAAAELARHRAELEAGQPCPLCGATEHPGVEVDEAAVVVEAEEAAVARRRADLDEVRADLARTEVRAERASEDVTAADGAIAAARAELAKIEADWDMARMSYGAGLPDAPDGAETAVAAAIEANHGAREACERERDEARAALERVERDRARVDDLLGELEAARAASAATREAARATDAERDRAAERLGAARSRVEQRQATLDAVFAGWPGWPALDGSALAAFDADVGRRVAAFETRRADVEAARGELGAVGRALAELDAAAEQRRSAAEEAAAEVERASAGVDALARRRAELLDGRTVEAVEKALRFEADKADAAASAARDARASAEAQAEGAADLLAEAERTARKARDGAEQARSLLDEALEAAHIDGPTLADLLDHGPDWIARTRTALEALHGQVKVAAALLRDRRAARQAHAASDRPTVVAEALDEALGAVTAAEGALRGVLEEARLRLRQDDEARRRRAELAPQLVELQAEQKVWGRLSDLIGSHDGGRFRDFAQSLTLDAVVGLANRHLRELGPRYRLARVPDQDLELQVIDLEMGDEVRSVQSLSGGESFLVSLALALGLASLSAREARLESLFIDEGFGTLDDTTLGQALSTLDALQASGRQVGLISHVPGFAERVGVQVAVVPEGPGRSRVEVRGVGIG